MELNNITLRPIHKNDYPAIEDIIRNIWKYDSLSPNPKDARHMSRLYLRSCLKTAAFSCVASDGDRVIGVILANSENSAHKGAIRRALSQLYAIMLLFTTRTGRQIGRFFSGFDQVDSELLESSSRAFDGEICFFAVSEEARGSGVGKRLFDAALDYFRSEHAQSFYLYTDTSCTYQFYEKRGLKRMGEKVVEFKPYTDYKLHMYLYGYDL